MAAVDRPLLTVKVDHKSRIRLFARRAVRRAAPRQERQRLTPSECCRFAVTVERRLRQADSTSSRCLSSPRASASFECMSMQYAHPLSCKARSLTNSSSSGSSPLSLVDPHDPPQSPYSATPVPIQRLGIECRWVSHTMPRYLRPSTRIAADAVRLLTWSMMNTRSWR